MEENRVYKVLLVDHRRADDGLIQRLMTGSQETLFQFSRVSTYDDAIHQVRAEKWDAILVNQDCGRHPGLELIHHIRLWDSEVPLLLLGEMFDYQLDYKARKLGASDYFAKDSLTASALGALICAYRSRQLAEESRKSNSTLSRYFQLLRVPLKRRAYHASPTIPQTGSRTAQ